MGLRTCRHNWHAAFMAFYNAKTLRPYQGHGVYSAWVVLECFQVEGFKKRDAKPIKECP